MNKNILVILFFLPLISKAQLVSDAKLWTGIEVTKKVNNIEFSLAEELRLDENVTHLDRFFTELGLKYKVVKGFYVTSHYRFYRDNDYETQSYDIRHRFDLGMMYKYKVDKFRFAFATKFQVKNALPSENSPTYNRNKLTLKYALNDKFTPFLSYEFYYQFNDQKVINRTRISLGSRYTINEKSALKLFYLFENRFNTKNLKHNHIYGISYSIAI